MQRRFLLKAAPLMVCSPGLFFGAGPAVSFAMAETSSQFSGYWMPEEAAPHTRTFMQWPVNHQVHPDHVFLEMLQQTIADIANTIVSFEPVVLMMDRRFEAAARKMLSDKVDIWHIPTDDLWCRDTGPVFTRNEAGELAIANLNFNGWGDKQVHKHDGKIASRLAEHLGLPIYDSGVVGEAGGLESDGDGTLIAHLSSWQNPNRNVTDLAEIEARLLAAFGASKIIWAPGVTGADITDYHIDSLARFVGPGRVLIQMPDEMRADDPWSKAAFETHDTLKAATDARGRALKLETIPEPYDTRVTSDDFVASYVNYYVCNGAVIAAQFGDEETDGIARETLQRLYPSREVITLNVDPLGEVGGGIHCATQQQPAV